MSQKVPMGCRVDPDIKEKAMKRMAKDKEALKRFGVKNPSQMMEWLLNKYGNGEIEVK